jgi:hypothetical protein
LGCTHLRWYYARRWWCWVNVGMPLTDLTGLPPDLDALPGEVIALRLPQAGVGQALVLFNQARGVCFRLFGSCDHRLTLWKIVNSELSIVNG